MIQKNKLISCIAFSFFVTQVQANPFELHDQTLSDHDLTTVFPGYCTLIDASRYPSATVSTNESSASFHYQRAQNSLFDTLSVLYSEGENSLTFSSGSSILLQTQGGIQAIGAEISNAKSIQAQHLNIQTKSDADAFALVLDSIQTPVSISDLTLKATGHDYASALTVFDTTVDLNGRVHLEAHATNDPQNAAWAISAEGSSLVEITSSGRSKIIGDIETLGTSSVRLTLQHPDDHWKGKTNSNTEVTVSNGARWSPTGDSVLDRLNWHQGGVLDVRDQTDTINIVADTIDVGSGTILRIDTTKADLDQDLSTHDLRIEGLADQVKTIDLYADNAAQTRSATPYTIAFVGNHLVDLNPQAQTFETALHTYRTEPVVALASVQSATETVFEITTETSMIGESTLAKNQLDFTVTNVIAHEQMIDRALIQSVDRLRTSHHGLWLDTRVSETELALHHRTREQTLQSQSFLLGYDRAMDLPWLTEAAGGISFGFADHEVKMSKGEADMDHWTLNAWLGGVTRDDYRVMLAGHYQYGQSTVKSLGLIGFQSPGQPFDFKMDSTVYGVSAYIGSKNDWGSDLGLALEPFIMGSSYWVKFDDAQSQGVRFQTDTLHQSIIRLGAHLSYQPNTTPLYGSIRLNWAHRFGHSTSLLGTADGLSAVFESEPLKESWAELALRAGWNKRQGLSFDFLAQVAKSKVVKPKFDIGMTVAYRY